MARKVVKIHSLPSESEARYRPEHIMVRGPGFWSEERAGIIACTVSQPKRSREREREREFVQPRAECPNSHICITAPQNRAESTRKIGSISLTLVVFLIPSLILNHPSEANLPERANGFADGKTVPPLLHLFRAIKCEVL